MVKQIKFLLVGFLTLISALTLTACSLYRVSVNQDIKAESAFFTFRLNRHRDRQAFLSQGAGANVQIQVNEHKAGDGKDELGVAIPKATSDLKASSKPYFEFSFEKDAKKGKVSLAFEIRNLKPEKKYVAFVYFTYDNEKVYLLKNWRVTKKHPLEGMTFQTIAVSKLKTYAIYSYEDLLKIKSEKQEGNFKLMRDLDLKGRELPALFGKNRAFDFDGNNKTIRNFKFIIQKDESLLKGSDYSKRSPRDTNLYNNQGTSIFGNLDRYARVHHLNFENVEIKIKEKELTTAENVGISLLAFHVAPGAQIDHISFKNISFSDKFKRSSSIQRSYNISLVAYKSEGTISHIKAEDINFELNVDITAVYDFFPRLSVSTLAYQIGVNAKVSDIVVKNAKYTINSTYFARGDVSPANDYNFYVDGLAHSIAQTDQVIENVDLDFVGKININSNNVPVPENQDYVFYTGNAGEEQVHLYKINQNYTVERLRKNTYHVKDPNARYVMAFKNYSEKEKISLDHFWLNSVEKDKNSLNFVEPGKLETKDLFDLPNGETSREITGIYQKSYAKFLVLDKDAKGHMSFDISKEGTQFDKGVRLYKNNSMYELAKDNPTKPLQDNSNYYLFPYGSKVKLTLKKSRFNTHIVGFRTTEMKGETEQYSADTYHLFKATEQGEYTTELTMFKDYKIYTLSANHVNHSLSGVSADSSPINQFNNVKVKGKLIYNGNGLTPNVYKLNIAEGLNHKGYSQSGVTSTITVEKTVKPLVKDVNQYEYTIQEKK